MEEALPKDKTDLIERIINQLSVAIKNCSLYPPGHSALASSIRTLKEQLDLWFSREEVLELGITHADILLDGKSLNKESSVLKNVAEHLHQRGIIALAIKRGVDAEELSSLLAVIKEDTKAIAKKGGVTANLKDLAHVTIKEIDYRSLLSGAPAENGDTRDESAMWQTLTSIGDKSKVGLLPESKSEFLKDFLKDPRRSATALNKIYKNAAAKIEEKTTITNMKKALSDICSYYDNHIPGDATDAKKDLTRIILELDPRLVTSLFESTATDGAPDIAKDIFTTLSDETIADTVLSFIKEEGGIGESLVSLFDKLATSKGSVIDIAMAVADKVAEHDDASHGAMTQLRSSVKELFKTHPESPFLSQMSMTVESFVDRGREIARIARYETLRRQCEEYLREGNLRPQRVRLVIDLLWLETDASRFAKLCSSLRDTFPDTLSLGGVETAREAVELLTEKLRPEQKKDAAILSEASSTMRAITSLDTMKRLLPLISTALGKPFDDIAYIFAAAKERGLDALLDGFIRNTGQSERAKFALIIAKAGPTASEKISQKMRDAASGDLAPVVKELLSLLKESSPDQAHNETRSLICHASDRIRFAALEGFVPRAEEERALVFDIFSKESNPEIKTRLMIILTKLDDAVIFAKLFGMLRKAFWKKQALIELIKTCGDYKARGSVPHLGKILTGSSFFGFSSSSALRVAAVASLGRINTAEAAALVHGAANDKSEAVRRMCSLVLDPQKTSITN